jgi:hypothetical protein
MIGLAVSGPEFDDGEGQTQWATLQQLSLILMASRLILLFQYGSTTYFAWKYRTTRLPLLLVMLTLGVAAILYLGLSFAFSLQTIHSAFIGWYVTTALELAANIAIAGRWHVVSFKGTHLVERMTCLTLIIVSWLLTTGGAQYANQQAARRRCYCTYKKLNKDRKTARYWLQLSSNRNSSICSLYYCKSIHSTASRDKTSY